MNTDDDFLDGICDLDAPMAAFSSDEDTPWLVMFADCWDDPAATAVRAHELRAWAKETGRGI